jgi:two-component system response regulator NreC
MRWVIGWENGRGQNRMVRVLIVEDEGFFRDMLKIPLNSLPGLDVVDAVSNGGTAIETAGQLKPDVVPMDIELGSETNGIEAGKSIK